jgi:transcriptional regulator with XRE-family HTH domain
MTTEVNVPALYAALDAERTSKGMSWRLLAKEVGVSPSLFSRLANGLKPDADSFAALVSWLGMDASKFFTGDPSERRADTEPALMTQLAPLLRARKDLSAADVELIEQIVQAAVARTRADD